MKKYLTFVAQDESVWGVPTYFIAVHRANHYAHEFGGDIQRSLSEDTLPLFESDESEIIDWAANNMSWKDFDGFQVRLKNGVLINFEKAWNNQSNFSFSN